MNELLLRRVLYGISCRNYESAAEAIPGAIGLSSSTVSPRIRPGECRETSGRCRSGICRPRTWWRSSWTGKCLPTPRWLWALGITITGDKRFLGFVETYGERAGTTPFLRSLMERGLDISEGVLVIVDGGKGLRAAVKRAFGNRALVQRCQWHKRENVVSYLSKTEQAAWRKRPSACVPAPGVQRSPGGPRTAPWRARGAKPIGRCEP